MTKATSYATYVPVVRRLPFERQTCERWRALVLDTQVMNATALTVVAGGAGLFTFDVGEVVTRGFFVVTTTFSSTSDNGTLKFRVNDATTSADLNSAVTVDTANLVAGTIIPLAPSVSGAVFNTTVAQQLEWVVATNALLTGKGTLYIATINLANLLANG
jgi:hypothetical protein